jgi:hypothetical protein
MTGKAKIIGNDAYIIVIENDWETMYPIWPGDQVVDGEVYEFKFIDEFTNPELFLNVGWGDSEQYAKIISHDN